MTYAADPGGVFESDMHRRVLGHLPGPKDDVAAFHESNEPTTHERVQTDQQHGLEWEEIEDVLSDLEASGFAKQTKAGWHMTAAGLNALQAGPPEGGEQQ
jgi:hypothetical protein